VPPFVTIIRIHGPFLFGTTDKLLEETEDVRRLKQVVILRLRNMTALDATGLHAIEKVSERLRASGRTLILCGAREQPARLLEQAAFVEHVGRDNIQPHVAGALARAREAVAAFDGVGDDLARELSHQAL
jgi:SulP family sulfate permease